jgi:hypothetical protein
MVLPLPRFAREESSVTMAKLGEGDRRWIVTERSDGANVNNWHWTTTDAMARTKAALEERLRAVDFPEGPLHGCTLALDTISGECAVNNRKGRLFLTYELALELTWTAGDSRGRLSLPDVSATELEELACTVTSDAEASGDDALTQPMRAHGVPLVTRAVRLAIVELQESMRASAAELAPAAADAERQSAAPPQPLKLDAVSANAAAAAASAAAAYAIKGAAAAREAGSAADGAADGAAASEPVFLGDVEEEEADAQPAALVTALAHLRHGTVPPTLRLSNIGLRDVHLPPLIEAISGVAFGLEALELAFNQLTDAGTAARTARRRARHAACERAHARARARR